MHYHVSTFQSGCLNDAEAGPFDTKRDAQDFALALANEYREQGYRVRGDQRRGYTVTQTDGWGTGYIIAVEPCDEPACMNDN